MADQIQDYICCEHIVIKRLDEDGVFIPRQVAAIVLMGTKKLALCKVCDNTLRGHYIGELENITIKIR